MPRTLAPLASKLGCASAICTGSHTIDVRGLDDRPPLLDFRFLQRRQSLGRLLLGREDLLSDIGKALAYGWIGNRFDGGLIELADDFSGRVRRYPKTVPKRHVESRHARLVDGRNLGSAHPTCVSQNCIGSDVAATHVGQQIRRLETCQVNLS